MKQLILKQHVKAKGSRFLYQYQVWEDGRLLCTRQSNREYVACYVRKFIHSFDCPHFFGKLSLIGEGGSKNFYKDPNAYAVAILQAVTIGKTEMKMIVK